VSVATAAGVVNIVRIALACGGTGGHIFPGVATGEILAGRGHDVSLWLAGKEEEKRLVKDWSGEVVAVQSEGFSDGISPRAMRTVWSLVHAAKRCTETMRHQRPDVLLGMGSYASVGPVVAAMRLHIPFVLHEANVLPGRAVNLFSRWAAAVAGSFEETRYYMRRKDIVLTGMPIRGRLASAARQGKPRELDPHRLTILVMGGSRGAHTLNTLVPQSLADCRELGQPFQVVHLSGHDDEHEVRAFYEKAKVHAAVYGFTQDMATIYAQTDLAITRAGAATCAELSAFGVPALLIPYPFAAKDHQTANARAMEKVGAADVVPESDLGASWLKDYVSQCIQNPSRLARMSAATRQRSQQRGAEALADLLERVAERQPDPAASPAV
jgi:UDP-N-acetylglucosamine--N-acetylmuramyl-(pentapeptide) pyrophosphoryl-undecaprenol N-acetylglucosamine transferase